MDHSCLLLNVDSAFMLQKLIQLFMAPLFGVLSLTGRRPVPMWLPALRFRRAEGVYESVVL